MVSGAALGDFRPAQIETSLNHPHGLLSHFLLVVLKFSCDMPSEALWQWSAMSAWEFFESSLFGGGGPEPDTPTAARLRSYSYAFLLGDSSTHHKSRPPHCSFTRQGPS